MLDDVLQSNDSASLRWKMARAWEILEREGWQSYVYRVLARCGYRRVDWYVGQLADAPPPPGEDCIVSICELGPEDLPAYLRLRPQQTEEKLLERMSRGNICHAAWLDDLIVSATWSSIGEAYLEFFDRAFSISNDEVYLFDTFTLRSYRGRRISGWIYAAIAERLAARGSVRATTFIEPKNRPMRLARERDGFVRMGYASDFKWGTHRFSRDRRTVWSRLS